MNIQYRVMRLRVILFFYCAFPFLVSGQNAVLKGLVTDNTTGNPLIAATIIAGKYGTVTETDGTYSLDLPPGPYVIEIRYVGFETAKTEINLPENGAIELDVSLILAKTMLQTATVTGSKYERTIATSPVSINVIKPDLAENTNTVRVVSLLEKVPGVQIIDNQANIRGGSGFSYGAGSRVLLLIDDVPAFQADAGRPNWGDIPVENISQIEVVKGASSTMYGSAALNGIINVRTGYATSEPVTKAAVAYTHYMSPKDAGKKWWDSPPHTLMASILHKQKFGKLDLVVNSFYENFDNYYENGQEEKIRFSLNGKYRFNARTTFSVNTMYNRSDAADYFLWGGGGVNAYRGFQPSFSERINTRFYIDPQLVQYDKRGNRHRLFGRLYYVDNDNNLDQSNASVNTFAEYQFLKDMKKLGLIVTSGMSNYFVRSDSELFGNVKLTSNNVAAYTQAEKEIGDKLNISFGLRYEYNTQKSPEVFKGDTIPGGRVSESKIIARAGLNYQVSDGTFFRASWGQGYRYPTITERFIETQFGSFRIFPNVFLGSETGWSTEMGIKQGFKIKEWEGFLDLSAFWSQYDNMTEFTFQIKDGAFGFQSQNVGLTDIKGFEIELIGRSEIFGLPLNIMGGYTYINPIYRDFEENTQIRESLELNSKGVLENVLKYRSKHTFKMDVEIMKDNLNVGVAAIYASEVVTMDALLATFAQIREYRTANPGGFVKMDARVGYAFDFAKISLVANNFLNEEYTLRPGLLEAPRNLSLRLDFNL